MLQLSRFFRWSINFSKKLFPNLFTSTAKSIVFQAPISYRKSFFLSSEIDFCCLLAMIVQQQRFNSIRTYLNDQLNENNTVLSTYRSTPTNHAQLLYKMFNQILLFCGKRPMIRLLYFNSLNQRCN